MGLLLAVCALVAAPLGALVGALVGRSSPNTAAVLAAICAAIGWALAIALALVHAVAPSAETAIGGQLLTVNLDGLAVVMLLLVLGLSAVIQFFAVRYLRGDPRQVWFVVTANLVTASTALMVTSSTVLIFSLAWLAAGASLLALLATYPGLAQAQAGVRRTALRFAIGDLPLLAAVTLLMLSHGGDVTFASLGAVIAALPTPLAATIAVLLIIPALARSSQIPFHGWLPATLAAPTPVSALMHAGVVNAGAILIVRFSPAIGESPVAMALVFGAGAVTLIYASAARSTKPDVKGRLVFSTMAQMGFMMLACGVGAFPAAVFHLVAHGLFKSSLFLGAGSVVSREAQQRAWPTRVVGSWPHVLAATAVALTVAIGSILTARAVLNVELSPASQGLQIFVVFTAAVALATALNTHFSAMTGFLGSLTVLGLAFGYTAVITVFDRELSFAAATGAVSAWWLIAPGAALVALQFSQRTAPATGLSRRAFALSLAAGSTVAGARQRPAHIRMGVSS